MRANNRIYHRPYIPEWQPEKASLPYICRLAPYETRFELEWFNPGGENKGTLYYSKMTSHKWETKTINSENVVVDCLDEYCDYELYIETNDGKQSNKRFIRTGPIEGTIVNYLHPDDGQYGFSGKFLGSPSLIKLPSGALLASHDYFLGGSTLTSIHRSNDMGKSWYYVTDLRPMFWGFMFLHKDRLYMIGVTTEYGDLHITCSDDEGKTWAEPVILLRGTATILGERAGVNREPMHIKRYKGRLWTTVGYGGWHSWDGGSDFYMGAISIDENADLMKAENWLITEFLPTNRQWDGYTFRAGAIEGNIIERPDGTLIDMMRYWDHKSMILKIDADHPEKQLEFEQVLDFDMGHSKFQIIEHNGEYIAIGNRQPLRNILSIYRSKDTINWEFVKDVVNWSEYNCQEVGIQYPSCFIEGDILYILARTSFNHAVRFHDANYITFHKVKLEFLTKEGNE